MVGFVAFALMLLLLGGRAAYGEAVHPGLADVVLSAPTTQLIFVEGHRIEYILRQQEGGALPDAYDVAFVDAAIRGATATLFRFFRQKGWDVIDLGGSAKLDIYYISSGMLNDHTRFHDWGKANDVTDKNTFDLWALYDPMKWAPKRSAIFLTHHTRWADELLIAHELCHYWYNRGLIFLSTDVRTEPIAEEFEHHYEVTVMNRG